MKVFHIKTGEALERDSCDAREMIAAGDYSLLDPALAGAPEAAAEAKDAAKDATPKKK